MNNVQTVRPLNAIGCEIVMDMESIAKSKHRYWRDVFPCAAPYAEALLSLGTIEDKYGFDSGREIVTHFLSNASTWKGEKAKAVKAELRKMVGLKK